MIEFRRGNHECCPSWAELSEAMDDSSSSLLAHVGGCASCERRWQLVSELRTYFPSSSQPGASRSLCPGPADWAALLDADIPTERRLELAEHLATCGSCATLWKFLARQMDGDDALEWELRETPATMPAAAEIGGARLGLLAGRWRGVAATVAAALMCLFVLVVLVFRPFPPVGSGGSSRWRGPTPAISSEVVWRADAPWPTMRWVRWPNASSYRVRVWNESGDIVAERHLTADTLELTLDIAGVDAGASLLFVVEELRNGEVLASADPERILWRLP